MAKFNKFILPNFIQSHEQVTLYIMQLDRYRSFRLQKSTQAEYGIKSNLMPSISGELKEYLNTLAKQENKNIEELVKEIHTFFKDVKKFSPRFNITFSSMPDIKFRTDLVEWFRKNIDELALISFHYDKYIAGGLILRSRNNIYDFSFATKIKNPVKSISSIFNEN